MLSTKIKNMNKYSYFGIIVIIALFLNACDIDCTSNRENKSKESGVMNNIDLSKLEKNDPDLINIMNNFVNNEVKDHGSLDNKLKDLILIVVFTTNENMHNLKVRIENALKIGVSPIRIKEAIYQCAPYIGFPKVLRALQITNEVFEKNNIELPLKSRSTVNKKTRFDKGLSVQKEIFGEIIDKMHKNAPDNLKHIQNYLSSYCFGDIYTRDGLDLKTRELLTLCILSSLGGCDSQVRSHVIGNLSVGNTKDNMLEAITQCLPYIGFPRTLNAISAINEMNSISKKRQGDYKKMNNENNLSESIIFPKGGKLPDMFSKYFTGKTYLEMIVPVDSELKIPIGNVTFEPGSRNNWHKHPGGQILLVTGGRGWYQEEGKEARELKSGDVVEILPNVKHWHGAAKDSWFVHLSIETDISKGPAQWLEPVADEDYNKLK